MRVALVTEYYYPHLGGVTEHVHNLARHLVAAGHEPLVITSHMQGAHEDDPWVRRIGTSRVIYSNGSFARITTGRNLGARMRDVLRTERVDVVHLHGGLAPTLGLVAETAADAVGVPVVGTFHSWFPHSALYRIFRQPLQKRLERYAAVIGVSHPVVAAHSRYFETQWQIIPNGVDTDIFHPNGRGSGNETANPLALLFLGRLDPRNGLDVVLKAMPAILDAQPAARLVVAGDGPLRPVYERLARPLGNQVKFIGHVNGERTDHYSSADMYLCPTNKASFGITLLEAMACGTPMIVSDITGFRELVDGGAEALLVPKADVEAWARATLELAGDKQRRVAMGAAGRAKSLRYSWPVVAQEIMAVYRKVMAS